MNNVFALETRYSVKNCSCLGFVYPANTQNRKSFKLRQIKSGQLQFLTGHLQEISTKKKIDIFDREWYALR